MSSLATMSVRTAGDRRRAGRARSPLSAQAQTPARTAAPLTGEAAQVKKLLEQKFQGATVTSVTKSPYFGLYEAMFDEQIVYTDAKVTYVLVGNVYDAATRKNLTDAKMRELSRVAFDSLPLELAMKKVKGNGSRRLAIFSDADCPFCARLENELKSIDNVTIYTFLYPIDQLHPDSARKSRIIWCAPDKVKAWDAFFASGHAAGQQRRLRQSAGRDGRARTEDEGHRHADARLRRRVRHSRRAAGAAARGRDQAGRSRGRAARRGEEVAGPVAPQLRARTAPIPPHGPPPENRHAMAIIDFLKKQFIDIIEWTDDSRDTLSFRFPDEDKEIKNGAQLIVRESQVAQFVYLGEFGDTFGPGKHTLTTDNIPILTNLKSWKYALESPFKADVYYVVTRVFAGNKWGTANPVMMRDADFGVVRLRAYGTYDFRVVDPKKFLKEVAGTDDHFRLDEFADAMRSRIVSVFSDALAGAKIPALDVASRYSELGEALLPLINPAIGAKYGLEMTTFIVENVSVPPEVEQAIDKRSSMAAVGNLNDYVKFQMAQGLEKGGGGPGGMAAEMAVGMAMAQQMMNQTGGLMAQSTPGVAAPARRRRLPELLTPAQVAKVLGVDEADVIASLDSGDLKGKKIGTQWRVTRAAVDAFLNGVNA